MGKVRLIKRRAVNFKLNNLTLLLVIGVVVVVVVVVVLKVGTQWKVLSIGMI